MDPTEEAERSALDPIPGDHQLPNAALDTEAEQAHHEEHRIFPEQLLVRFPGFDRLLSVRGHNFHIYEPKTNH